MKYILLTFTCLLASICCLAQKTPLEDDFIHPPQSIQTSVYWYWMCGNISREGVIKDLEAMKKAGINRAFIANIYFEPYKGGRNVRLMSDEWWEVTHTALKKASELGIEIGMFNCSGWTQAGGPWVKPHQAMRYLTNSEKRVAGPAKIQVQLEKPAIDFEDVKVIAYPAPEDDIKLLNKSNAKIEVSPALPNQERMFDGEKNQGTVLPENTEVVVHFTADAEFTARSLTIYPAHSNINATFELQAKKGTSFTTISEFVIDWHHLNPIVGFKPFAPVTITLDETKVKEFRLVMKNRRNEGGIAEIELSAAPLIENYASKTMAKMFQDPMPPWDYYLWRKQPEASRPSFYINPSSVLDISQYMSADGVLNWNAPKGEWVILRTGMMPTGVTNNPSGPDGTGLEVDKINKQHLSPHFDAYIGKILERIPAEDRKTFKVIVQDSYESGGLNFTDNFLASFKERYGYDALPFLPAYFGKVVGSQYDSDRFLWDMRRLVADKVAYEYVGGFRELAHQHGLHTWLENYGHWGFPAEFLMYGGQSDEVAGEFWLPNHYPSWENDLGNIENRAASSCAHIYGKNLVSSESHTSGAPAFTRVPSQAKQRMDKYFAEGINNTLLHVYIHQPDDKQPGTNAWFGTEFNRNNTWFSHIDLFIDYIKRCNYMLRQGLNIADVAYYVGEDTPKMTGVQDPAMPSGYQFDYINAEVLLRDAVVRNGLITLPHGTTYRVLVLPKVKSMRPEVLAKIRQLVADGATVLGPPPTHSPSLQNQPRADILVGQMATELWKEVDGEKVTSRKFGKGMIFNGVNLEQVFAAIGCVEDCKVSKEAPIHFGHRRMSNTDIYFVCNQSETNQNVNIQFRVEGMQPELFNPMIGSSRKLTEFSQAGNITTVPIVFAPYESAFIVFRKKGEPVNGSKNFPEPIFLMELNTPWDIEFHSKLTNPAPIRLDWLQDISMLTDYSVRCFSGNMIYTTTFDLPESKGKEIYLNLGEVKDMAKVWINGQYMGGVWTPPYRLKISDALKPGSNTLRIDLVNTWVNRLIGDLSLPEEKRETWTGINPYETDFPLQKSGLTGPVNLEYILLRR